MTAHRQIKAARERFMRGSKDANDTKPIERRVAALEAGENVMQHEIDDMEKRITALEHQHDWMLLNGSWASNPAPVAADQPAVSVRDYRVERAECYVPDGYRAKDQPAGDDAAVEALEEAILSCDGATAEEACQDAAHDYAKAILAAIRSGGVPGIRALTFDQLALVNERDMIRGAAEQLGHEVADLRAKLKAISEITGK